MKMFIAIWFACSAVMFPIGMLVGFAMSAKDNVPITSGRTWTVYAYDTTGIPVANGTLRMVK